MNFVELSINICVSLLCAVITGGLIAGAITALFDPSPEVVPAIVIVCMVLAFVAVMWLLYSKDISNT